MCSLKPYFLISADIDNKKADTNVFVIGQHQPIYRSGSNLFVSHKEMLCRKNNWISTTLSPNKQLVLRSLAFPAPSVLVRDYFNQPDVDLLWWVSIRSGGKNPSESVAVQSTISPHFVWGLFLFNSPYSPLPRPLLPQPSGQLLATPGTFSSPYQPHGTEM